MVMFTQLNLFLLKFFFTSHTCYIGGVQSSAGIRRGTHKRIISSSSPLLLSSIEPLLCDRYFVKHIPRTNIPLSPYNNSLRWTLLSHPFKVRKLTLVSEAPKRLGHLPKNTPSMSIFTGCGSVFLSKDRI